MIEYPVSKAGLGAAPHRLHDALVAAGVPIVTVRGSTGPAATVLSETSGLQSQIDAVLATLDPTVETPGEQQADADQTSFADLRAQYQTMLTAAGNIHTDMAQITAGPNTPTAAQTGNALKMLARDLDTLTTGLERLIKALAAIVRQQTGP